MDGWMDGGMCEYCWLEASGEALGHPHQQQPNLEKLLMRKVQAQAAAPSMAEI